MTVCEIAQGVLLAVIAFTLPPLPLLLALVGVRAVIGQVSIPASRAAVPSLVASKDLARANTALGLGSDSGGVIGPFLAAVLLRFTDTRGVLPVDAVSFGLSALLLLRLPKPGAGRAGGDVVHRGEGRGERDLAQPCVADRVPRLLRCRRVHRHRRRRGAAADDGVFGGSESVAGVVLGAVGVGLLLGYALPARGAARWGMVALLVTGFLISSAGNLFTGLACGVASAFALQAVRGLGIAAMDVASSTLVGSCQATGRAGGSATSAAGSVWRPRCRRSRVVCSSTCWGRG